MTAYLRFGWVLLFSGPVTFAALLAGGVWSWFGMFGPMGIMLLGDALMKDDLESPQLARPALLNIFLFGQLPWTIIALVLLGWKVSPGDALGIGAWVQSVTGWDVLARRETNIALSIVQGLGSCGLLLSANFFIAHELVHRRSRVAVGTGNLLLASVCDSQFTIAHLYEHHKHVCTPADPATARRGESLYRFAVRSTIGQFAGAFNLEKARLASQGRSPWSLDNRFLVGQGLTLLIIAAMGLVFGWQGVVAYLICVLYAKFLYEAVNYIQHYGLVRVPNTPVEARHAWDCASRMSSIFMFNLTRHADHHARGDAPFWELNPGVAGPRHKYGYFVNVMVAMVPSLWRSRMDPLLAHWDKTFATRAELALLRPETSVSRAEGVSA